MKKSKRILSAITALALSASAFASMVIPASAAETQIGSTYTFDTTWSAETNSTAAILGVDDGKLKWDGTGSGGRLGVATIPSPVTPEGTDPVKVEFDWTTSMGPANSSSDIALADGASKTNGTEPRIFTINHSHGAMTVNGVNTGLTDIKSDSSTVYTFKVSALLDFETKRVISVTLTPSGGKSVSVYDLAFINNDAAKIDTVVFEAHRGEKATVASHQTVDNLAFFKVTGEHYKATLTVVPSSGTPVADATVKLGRNSLDENEYDSEYKTDSNGQIVTKLAPGEYKYSVSKPGCETTSGASVATGTFTVENAAFNSSVAYGPKTYTSVPDQVEIISGPRAMTAPIKNASVESAPFVLEMYDQEGVKLTNDDVTISYSIAPSDEKVAINSTSGVITVSKGFNGGDSHIKTFTVTGTVSKNGTDKTVTREVKISDYLFYEPGVESSSYGDVNTGTFNDVNYLTHPSTLSYNSITFPEPVEFEAGKVKRLSFKTLVLNDTGATFQRVLWLVDKDNVDTAVAATSEGAPGRTKPNVMAIGYINTKLGNSDTAVWNSSDAVTKFNDEYGSIATDTWTDVSVQFMTNAEGVTSAKVTVGDNVTQIGTIDKTNIAAIQMGQYMQAVNRYPLIKDIILEEVDPNLIEINGSAAFSSVPGNTVEKEYEVIAPVVEEGETFNWTTTITGATITADTNDSTKAILSVPGTVTSGGTITATSAKTPAKTATINVEIAKANVTSYKLEGAKAVHYAEGATVAYKLTDVKDQNGDDITKYINPVWSLEGQTETVEIPKATFTVDASAVGTDAVAIFPTYDGTALKSVATAPTPIKVTGTTVNVEGKVGQKVLLWDSSLGSVKPLAPAATITGTDINNVNYITNTGVLNINKKKNETVVATVLGDQEIKQQVKVDTFYLQDPNITDGKVDISSLVTDDQITGYQVTTSTNGTVATAVVPKTDVTENKIAITGSPDEIEIAPIYTISENIPTTDYRGTFLLPADTYNFKVTATGQRADFYANDQILINNMLQYGSTPNVDEAHDIYVKDGYITVSTTDYSNGKGAADTTVSGISVVKAPSIVSRVPKVYVIGDSLVAKYYNADKSFEKLSGETDEQQRTRYSNMTGWGQVLGHYLTDDVEVIDLANSGADAPGLIATAFTQVAASAKAGDIMILESGYNDKGHKNITEEMMNEAVSGMYNQATAKGVTAILVSPNASAHDYGAIVAWSDQMGALATKLGAEYINLSALSYGFLHDTCGYGDAYNTTEALSHFYNVYSPGENGLHSTFYNANACAALVATAMMTKHSDIVNADATFTFTDPNGATVKLQPNAITFTPAE